MSKIKKLTPMLQQFLAVKEKHPDKLILFRMGDFYETFFDDAKIASKVLGITLTARNKKADDPIPLAGFPYHALDNYLDKLVKNGLKIVICEQVEDPKKAKGLVKRDIVDIITPGSIIDGKLINKSDNNFLISVVPDKNRLKFGIARIDISTGDFYCTELESQQLKDEIQRINPSEIIVESKEIEDLIKALIPETDYVITLFDSWYFDHQEAVRVIKNHFNLTSLEGFGLLRKTLAQIAAGSVLGYIKTLKNAELKHISNISYYSISDHMQLDETTRRNLELIKSMRYNDRSGSLIAVIDKTRTPMGARRLKSWLLNPLLDIEKINYRLDAVETLKNNFNYTEDIRSILNEIGDLSRIISKVGTQRVNPRDLIALHDYLNTAPMLSEMLTHLDNPFLYSLKSSIGDYSEILQLISTAILDNPPLVITDGNIIKDGYNSNLDELREIRNDGKGWIARLEEEERKNTGIPSLKVGYNRVFGYYLEVTKTHQDKVPEAYIKKQTLVNADRYISPQLKEYEVKVLGAEERIKSLEYELFSEIRDTLFQKVNLMQFYVEIIAQLDVLCSFAYLAYKNNFCKPQFNQDGLVEVINSRHPVIEDLLDTEEFIPNDVNLNNTDTRIALITGPNMAGKSTYLRQVGIIAIMAQIGSFIPASSANLPVFDKVFTRVGASDNLAMGQSTFLVEMLETANILNSATPNSLILLDEIGRGTSTFDGLSLAWSIVEYIHNTNRVSAKTLFATHYHELTELENILEGVKNYNILVREWNEKIIFLRKIERGCADQSYGIQVARLAGVPARVITRAKNILRNLEEHELSPQGLSANAKKNLAKERNQMDIFDAMFDKVEEKNRILDEIKDLDINNMTPMEAIQKIQELQKRL